MSEVENQNNTEEKRNKKLRTRTIIVLIALALFSIGASIIYRANYLEIFEIGEEYVNIFMQNVKYKIYFGIANFIFVFLAFYITNKFIKAGLKKFFEQAKKEMPKLPNKSIALICALITTIIVPDLFLEKIILFLNNAQFGIADPIFNLDVGYYMFQAPLIGSALFYLIAIIIGLTIYIAIYYIITFNVYFDGGIDGQTLKNNIIVKLVMVNIMIITILIVLIMLFNMQNIVLDSFLNINDTSKTGLVGAGTIDSSIKLWGYRILGVIIIISVFMAIRYFRKDNVKNVIKSLSIVPIYLATLFFVVVGYNMIFVSGNELDKEKFYINTNIDFTKTAYNLKIEEKELNSTGTITREEADKNKKVIDNIPITTEKIVLDNLLQTQTNTGYYTYNSAKPTYYNDKLIYVSAREINRENTTYNSQGDEYTHGYGTILVSASETDENGNTLYLSKDFAQQEVSEPRIYYGLETNSIITISEDQREFDYPTTSTRNETYVYNGDGGMYLDFIDKMALSIKNRNLKILLSKADSKILLNRNIIERAKKIMPYLIYDEKPYLVLGDDENLYWVLDAYTISNEYPYSQKTKFVYENETKEINYIRNSVKVIINAYDGDTNFYITDKTDPIAMVYNNMYDQLFKEESEIPEEISKYFTYSEFLYNIQAEMLTKYHDVSADVLYRANDVWQIASYSNLITANTTTQMTPIYTTLKTVDSEEGKVGLVIGYNMFEKNSMNAYLVGTVNEGKNVLTLYKFSNDSSVVGPMQLDSLIGQDERISNEISSLNVTGTRITKEMVIVPIDNTILYVIPIYQTSLNEKTNSVPILKKIIVASGNRVAIGNEFSEALKNLLSSDSSVDIEVTDTSTVEGLIDMIIRANNNLTESNNSNDWGQIGRDIEQLQNLIKELEAKREENQKQEEDTNVDVPVEENVMNN